MHYFSLKRLTFKCFLAKYSTLQYLLWGPAVAILREKPQVLIMWAVGVGLGVWWEAYSPIGSLDHVRAFFKFLALKGVWHGGGTILKPV